MKIKLVLAALALVVLGGGGVAAAQLTQSTVNVGYGVSLGACGASVWRAVGTAIPASMVHAWGDETGPSEVYRVVTVAGNRVNVPDAYHRYARVNYYRNGVIVASTAWVDLNLYGGRLLSLGGISASHVRIDFTHHGSYINEVVYCGHVG